jgi:hypothetical protein
MVDRGGIEVSLGSGIKAQPYERRQRGDLVPLGIEIRLYEGLSISMMCDAWCAASWNEERSKAVMH